MNNKNEITLQEINRSNYRQIFALQVKEAQKRYYPRSNEYSVGEASFYEDSWYRAICLGDRPVGFVMLSLISEKGEYFAWRFMIDQQHQRKGYGTRAMSLIVDFVKT